MTTPPTNQFVPLVATLPSTEKREFQITIIPQGDPSQKFQSFEKPATKSNGGTPKNCEPQISLQRDNGRVTGIHIECSCGQIIDLSCIYETAKSEAPPIVAPAVPPKSDKSAKPAKPKK